MAQSLVNDAEQSGSYPRWALANSATGEMTGDNVVPLVVNLYTFGVKDFELKKALYYMLKAATDGGVGRGGYVERPGIASYLQRGYAPQAEEFSGDHGIDGASITLEWAVDDFAICRFADALGDTAISAEFQNRAQYWQNLFNPSTGYISPRSADGAFLDGPGFAEPTSDFGQDGFDEGNAAQYLWLVPQNIAGLVTALGGRQAAAERLDGFTAELNAGPDEPYLWIGNEPGFGVPWLYNYVGQPWKTQQTVEGVRRELVRAHPRRGARQRRPRRAVQLVCLGFPRPVPEHPGNPDSHGKHTALRSRRDRASRGQIHPDLRLRRIERPDVHQRP
jgi:putative alpha-1,2-mannosidase